jgi:hypothetical protein
MTSQNASRGLGVAARYRLDDCSMLPGHRRHVTCCTGRTRAGANREDQRLPRPLQHSIVRSLDDHLMETDVVMEKACHVAAFGRAQGRVSLGAQLPQALAQTRGAKLDG